MTTTTRPIAVAEPRGLTRGRHPIFARFYRRMSRSLERRGYAERRRQLLAGLSGRVIEIGAGNGLNFPHYPTAVTAVLAVEPEPYLRHLAEVEARSVRVRVEVVTGLAEQLPVEDASFDAAVLSLVLCSVRDPATTLAEIHRVLRPGGELRFLEHVRAGSLRLCRVQRLLDASIWPWLGGGCHASRDAAGAIEAAGFALGRVEPFRFPETRVPLPTSPHVVGRARRA